MEIQLTDSQRKIGWFAFAGAIGCFVGAILGELLLLATWRPAVVEQQALGVCLLLDCSGSMGYEKLAEVKAAAVQFVRRRQGSKDKIAVVGFGSQAHVAAGLSDDTSGLEAAIAALDDGGSTNMSAGLSAAMAQLDAEDLPGRILLFTDGMPDGQSDTLLAADLCRNREVRIVAVATPDADRGFLERVTGDVSAVVPTKVGDFEQAFQRADKVINSRQLAESKPTRAGLIYGTARMGLWSALLAAGIAIALIVGQKFYLTKTLGSLRQAMVGGMGGFAAGLLAGSLGQLLFAQTHEMPSPIIALGRIVAWTVLGALVGMGLAFFVPNLKAVRGLAGGAVGGVLGAVGFLVVGLVLGDAAARLAGAAIVGVCIGGCIALIEAVLREGWLEVHYGRNEKRTVTLGRKPVAIGSSPEFCTVIVRNAPDVALRYTLRDGRITCEDVPADRTFDVLPGDRRMVDTVSVVVCGARAAKTETVVVTKKQAKQSTAQAAVERQSEAEPPSTAERETADFYLRIRGRRVALVPQGRLTASDLPGLETNAPDGTVAEVAAHPNDPSVLGLKNVSLKPWSATMPDGKTRDIDPGRSVRLTPGTEIRFGVLKGTVE